MARIIFWSALLLVSDRWIIASASAEDYDLVGEGECQDPGGGGRYLPYWMKTNLTLERCRDMCSNFSACVTFDAEEQASVCMLRFSRVKRCMDDAQASGAANTKNGEPWGCVGKSYSGFTWIGRKMPGRKCYEKISSRIHSPICGKCGCSVCRPNARFQSSEGSVDWCRSPEKHPDECPASMCECPQAATSDVITASSTAEPETTAAPAAEPQQQGMSGGLMMLLAAIAAGSCGIAVVILLCFGLGHNTKRQDPDWYKHHTSTMWELEKKRRQPTMLGQLDVGPKRYRSKEAHSTAVEVFGSQEAMQSDLELHLEKESPPTPSTTSGSKEMSILGSKEKNICLATFIEPSLPPNVVPEPPNANGLLHVDMV